jgi:hypothetical protein
MPRSEQATAPWPATENHHQGMIHAVYQTGYQHRFHWKTQNRLRSFADDDSDQHRHIDRSQGPRYGIDFAGGTLVQVKFEAPVSIDGIKSGLKNMAAGRVGSPAVRPGGRQ